MLQQICRLQHHGEIVYLTAEREQITAKARKKTDTAQSKMLGIPNSPYRGKRDDGIRTTIQCLSHPGADRKQRCLAALGEDRTHDDDDEVGTVPPGFIQMMEMAGREKMA